VHGHATTQTVLSYVHKYAQINSEFLQACVFLTDAWHEAGVILQTSLNDDMVMDLGL